MIDEYYDLFQSDYNQKKLERSVTIEKLKNALTLSF